MWAAGRGEGGGRRWANVSKQNKAGIVVIGMAAKSPDAAMSASMDSLEPVVDVSWTCRGRVSGRVVDVSRLGEKLGSLMRAARTEGTRGGGHTRR